MGQDADFPGCGDAVHPPREALITPPEDTIEKAAVMLRAAGDAGRLRILLRLAAGERCVTELAEAEDDKVATVSARLKQLHTARLVTRRREAKHIYYALADEHVTRLLHDIIDHAAEGEPAT